MDFGMWELLKQNVYLGRRITDLDSLKEAIVEEWNKIPQEISDKVINAFKPRLWCVIHMEICQYVFVKAITISMNGSFFPHPCINDTEQTCKNIFTYKL